MTSVMRLEGNLEVANALVDNIDKFGLDGVGGNPALLRGVAVALRDGAVAATEHHVAGAVFCLFDGSDIEVVAGGILVPVGWSRAGLPR